MLKFPIMQKPIIPIRRRRINLFSSVNWTCFTKKKQTTVTRRVHIKIVAFTGLLVTYWKTAPSVTEPKIAIIFIPMGMYASNYLKPDWSKYIGSHRSNPYRRAFSKLNKRMVRTTIGSLMIVLSSPHILWVYPSEFACYFSC